MTEPIRAPFTQVTVGAVAIAPVAAGFAEVVTTAAGVVVLAALEASRRVKAASANATGESTGSGALPPDAGSTGEVAVAETGLDTRAEVVGATERVVDFLDAVALAAPVVFAAWLVALPDELECWLVFFGPASEDELPSAHATP